MHRYAQRGVPIGKPRLRKWHGGWIAEQTEMHGDLPMRRVYQGRTPKEAYDGVKS